MPRVVLVHAKPIEAEEGIARLQQAGYEVDLYANPDAAALRSLREAPPEAFVIALERAPSHGRAVAVWLRQQRRTRHVPIVFVGGETDKVSRVRNLLPDAVFSEWTRVTAAVKGAIAAPPPDPVVPGTMDAYSARSLPEKLGIRTGSVVALLAAPGGFEQRLGELPDGVRLKRRAVGRADLVLLFARSRVDLDRRFGSAARIVSERGSIWIVWPKRSSGIRSDLSQQVVRRFGLARDFVDYKICAVDQTWSGLRFARRRGSGGAS
jgi:CheY-like chemotaxis protein